MSPAEKQHRFRIFASFGLVYVLWGGTYLAMRVAVEHIPPYAMGAIRFLIAGPMMLGWCALSGRKVRLNRHDLLRVAAIGILLLSIGNMAVASAEQYVPSGLAALIVAIMPIWVAVIETLVFRVRGLPFMAVVGLALGFSGMAVLLWPKLANSQLGHTELVGVAILLVGSLSWAFGSVLSGRWTLSVDVLTSTGWQMTFGGLVNLAVASVTGSFHRAQWTPSGMGAIAYLVICGSWIGFTCYIWLLEHVPTPKVATYAYINPIVAVFLGWLLLHEPVDAYMIAGSVIIIGAVALVNASKLRALRSNLSSGAANAGFSPAGTSGD